MRNSTQKNKHINTELRMQAKLYFGFGIAPSMFPDGFIMKSTMAAELACQTLKEQQVIPCLNPSHKATIDAMRSRFGINVEIPDRAPQVKLGEGDHLLVMGVTGLPRLEGRHEYSNEEIAAAEFTFTLWWMQKTL